MLFLEFGFHADRLCDSAGEAVPACTESCREDHAPPQRPLGLFSCARSAVREDEAPAARGLPVPPGQADAALLGPQPQGPALLQRACHHPWGQPGRQQSLSTPALAGEGCGGVGRGLSVPREPLALPQPLAEPDPDAPASSSASAAAGLKAQASVPQPHPPPQWVPKDSPCCLLPPACSAWCPQAAGVDGAWASLLATSLCAGLARLSPSVCARHACPPLSWGRASQQEHKVPGI